MKCLLTVPIQSRNKITESKKSNQTKLTYKIAKNDTTTNLKIYECCIFSSIANNNPEIQFPFTMFWLIMMVSLECELILSTISILDDN